MSLPGNSSQLPLSYERGDRIASYSFMPGREFFLWQVRNFTVRLELGFVEKLSRQLADQRLNAGEENGGVLFGRVIEKNTVEVTGFEFIRSEHRRGVLYDPGGRERARIAKYVKSFEKRKEDRPVGYFRTHLRPGLFLDQGDFALMTESFAKPPMIALAVKPEGPGPANAGIFFWEDDDIDRKQTYLMFPFDAATLRVQGPIHREIPGTAPTGKPSWTSRLRASPTALLWGAAVLMSVFAIIAAVHRIQVARAGKSSVSQSQRVAEPTQIASSEPAPVVPVQPELQPGTNAPPAVFDDSPAPAGGDRPSPLRGTAPAVRARPATPKSKPEPIAPPAEVQPDAGVETAPPARDMAPRPESAPAPVPLPPPPASIPEPTRNITVDIVLEYKEPGGLKRMAGHIPLLGRTIHNDSGYSPPRPTASLRPVVPADTARALSGEASVDVVVSIDKSGAVRGTELTKGAGTGLGTLAAVTAASVPWEPARSGDRTVATSVVIHYRFIPPAQ